MDDVARYNRERWDALVGANALFTRGYLDIDAVAARARLDPSDRLGDLTGKRVLCLASGGGQQSVAFALLGAEVIVFDLSPAQLDRDRQTAVHYGFAIRTELGDMRDLSRFDRESFDLVWHPYSINFVPDCLAVFHQVARILRPGSVYHVMIANPFTIGMRTFDWTGDHYPLRRPYIDGAEIIEADESWVYQTEDGRTPISPPREYRHSLSTVVNGLVSAGFTIDHLAEHTHGAIDAEPGSWDHFTTFAPPWFEVWTTLGPRTG